MVAAEQFPMFRLGALLARQLSAPLARRIKVYAEAHPWFGRHVCARVARGYGAAESLATRAALRAYGRPAPTRHAAPPLSRRQAREVAGDLLGEVIVFTLGASILVFEVNRQAAKQEVKKLDVKSRWLALRLTLEELRREASLQAAELRRLRAQLEAHEREAARGNTPPAPAPGSDGPRGSTLG